MAKSATAMVLAKLPSVLTKEGQSFQEVWDKLTEDKELAKVLTNEQQKPRLGVLQGISTRIKAHQIPGFAIIKDTDGALWFKVDAGLDLYKQEVEKHIKLIQQLPFPEQAPTDAKASRHAIDVELEKIESELAKMAKANEAAKETDVKSKPDNSANKTKSKSSTAAKLTEKAKPRAATVKPKA